MQTDVASELTRALLLQCTILTFTEFGINKIPYMLIDD